MVHSFHIAKSVEPASRGAKNISYVSIPGDVSNVRRLAGLKAGIAGSDMKITEVPPSVLTSGPQRIQQLVTQTNSAVTFIDSSGLRVLVALSNEAAADNAALTLRNVPRHAERVLDLTGLAEFFQRRIVQEFLQNDIAGTVQTFTLKLGHQHEQYHWRAFLSNAVHRTQRIPARFLAVFNRGR